MHFQPRVKYRIHNSITPRTAKLAKTQPNSRRASGNSDVLRQRQNGNARNTSSVKLSHSVFASEIGPPTQSPRFCREANSAVNTLTITIVITALSEPNGNLTLGVISLSLVTKVMDVNP